MHIIINVSPEGGFLRSVRVISGKKRTLKGYPGSPDFGLFTVDSSSTRKPLKIS